MSHAYSRNYVHLVFSTKERRNWIRDLRHVTQMFRTIASTYGVEFLEIGGTKNHVHLLFALPPKIAIATLVRALKGKSSKWLSEEGHLFAWQEGYGSFSVGASQMQATREYIQKQEEHHSKHTYESEFLSLLKHYGIDGNPERVFG